MPGHASATEIPAILLIEAQAAQLTASTDDLLRLVAVKIEPLHEDATADHLVRRVLRANPAEPRAVLWLAHLALHWSMTPAALEEAVLKLRLIGGGDDEYAGGAALLTAECLDDLGRLDSAERTLLLRRSVALAPGWVFNHSWLAECLLKSGDHQSALAKMEEAASNIRSPVADEDLGRRAFETCITGRYSSRARMARRLSELRGFRNA